MIVPDLFSLDDKVAVVTGGDGRLGRCIVEGLAEAGARVVSTSIDQGAGDEVAASFCERGLTIENHRLDLGDLDSIDEFSRAVAARYGSIDVLINNAIVRPMRRYDDDISAWSNSMESNATGLFALTRRIVDIMNDGGSVVNIASMQAMYSPDFTLYEGTDRDSPPDYHFHKAGLVSLTRYMARRFGSRGIRFNSLSPGAFFDNQSEPFYSRYVNKVPLGRMMSCDDLKGAVEFLATAASGYINGENILMDGGLHV